MESCLGSGSGDRSWVVDGGDVGMSAETEATVRVALRAVGIEEAASVARHVQRQRHSGPQLPPGLGLHEGSDMPHAEQCGVGLMVGVCDTPVTTC